MNIKLFQSEIEAGLAELIEQNSIAYLTEITPSENINFNFDLEHPKEAIAGDKAYDLFGFNSILVSVGWNGNDDVFAPQEVWAAKDTPIHKRININHNEKEIVGVMTAAVVLDNEGNVYNGTDPLDQYDLAVSAVLYKHWRDSDFQNKINQIITEIGLGQWKVSMECLFPHFDYALKSETESKIIERDESTAYLSKYLRVYGGCGVYEGAKIGRVLRNLQFSGKGLVKNPANKRSIILQSEAFQAPAMEKQMDNVEKAKFEAQIAELTKANKELSDKLDAVTEQVKASEKEKFEAKLAEASQQVGDVQAKLDEATKKVNDLTASIQEKDEKIEALSKSVEDMKKEKEKMEKEKKMEARKYKLSKSGLTEEKASEVVSKFENLDDEQFDEVAKLYKPETNSEAEASEADLDNAEEDQEAALASDTDVKTDTQTSLNQAVAKMLSTKE